MSHPISLPLFFHVILSRYANDAESILKFKAREDTLTQSFYVALDEINAAEDV